MAKNHIGNMPKNKKQYISNNEEQFDDVLQV